MTDGRCKCCRRPLHIDNETGFCRRKICLTHLYKESEEYRKRLLKKNNDWHAKKYKTDPAWAERRRAACRLRMKKLRDKMRSKTP